jgi:PAS domain S-box
MSATETGITMEELLKIKWMYEEQQKTFHLGTWEWDIQNNKAYWSKEAYRIYGIDPGTEMNYRIAARHRHPDDFLSLEKALRDAVINKKPYHTNYRIIRADGEIRHIHGYGKVLYNKNGIPIKIIGSIQDITEQKKIEDVLQERMSQTIAMNAELERANKNKDEFLSIFSHELKNPLSTIIASLSLFEMTGSERSKKIETIIKRQVNHMCKLVDDLLDLARINQNKIKLNKESILLNELLMHLVEDIKPEFDIKNIQLVAEIGQQPIYLYADPVRITQCVWNIMSNALKFTDEGGTVKLSMQKEGNEVLILIKDNGIGVSPGILPKLFEQFLQADDSTDTHNKNGLGLGLFIVKNIVEMHEGKVTANSEGLGKGAAFTIYLPISEEKDLNM